MTITFRCPKCKSICAFRDRYTERQARCRSCSQVFIIPSKDGEKPEKVKIKVERGEPIPGFYRGVLDSWKIFINRQSIVPLACVITAVSFKFFLAGACCINILTYVITWGWLFAFYLNIVHDTAFGIDDLPGADLGTSSAFTEYFVRPLLIFTLIIVLTQLPYITARVILKNAGIHYENIWLLEFGWVTLLQVLYILGWFFFPMALLIASVGEDFIMLRPDMFVRSIAGAFVPYIIAASLLLATAILELHTANLNMLLEQPTGIIAGHLLLNLAVQTAAIIAMRSIGLLYRHYNCKFPWDEPDAI